MEDIFNNAQSENNNIYYFTKTTKQWMKNLDYN